MENVLLLVLSLFVGGILWFALCEFFKLPPSQRFQAWSRAYRRERRAQDLQAGRAVVIRAQPVRAARRLLILLLLILPIVPPWYVLMFVPHAACREWWGLNLWLAMKLWTLVVVSIWMSLALILGFWRALKIRRDGFWPPLDSAFFQDVVARRGFRARLWAYIGLWQMPLLLLLMTYVVPASYQQITMGVGIKAASHEMHIVCVSGRSVMRPY